MDDNRQQKIDSVRAVLDWLEAHPSVGLPYDINYGGFMITEINTKDDVAALAREFGQCEKEFLEDSFYLRKRFGTSQLYAFVARNEVCERVVVGTWVIPERVEPSRVVEEVEWKCHEPLLNGDTQ